VTLDRLLHEGFRQTHRHFGLVLLDLVWKAVWFVLTAVALGAAAMWFGLQLRSLGWAVATVSMVSLVLWFVLEAAFRSSMIAGRFHTFLFARVLKCLSVASATLLLTAICFNEYFAAPVAEWRRLWPDTRGALLVILFAIGGIGFFLTIIETLIRTDAIELLGTDLFRVTGLIGILVLFEMMVSGSCALMVAAGFLNITGLPSALVMAGTAVVAFVFVNVLHSYLLHVRFSAIGIMRKNVVEI
jgi:hypothetical protein